MSITFAAQLNKMITAGLGGAMDAPETNVAVGFRFSEKTVSGNPVSFSDGAGGKPVKSLEIGFSPVQDLHGYDHPWPAGGGKNLFSGFTIGISISASTGAESVSNTSAASDFIPFDPSKTYYLSGLSSDLFSIIYSYNSNKEFLGRSSGSARTEGLLDNTSFPYGTPQGTGDIAYIRVQQTENPGTTGTIDEVEDLEVLLEVGTEATAYEPYSNICPITGWSQLELNHADATEEIQLGATYYAGTVDVVSGEGSVTYGMVDLGTLDWTDIGNNIFRAPIAGIATESVSSDRRTGIVCTAYAPSATVAIGATMTDKSMLRASGYFFIRNTDYSDAADFKAAMSGVQLCYELATPIPITLTPLDIVTQEGGNIFITDANGNMAITYTAVGYTEGY